MKAQTPKAARAEALCTQATATLQQAGNPEPELGFRDLGVYGLGFGGLGIRVSV